MRLLPPARLRPKPVAVLSALLACLALPPARPAAGGPGAERQVELELAGVVPVGGDGACILVLKEKGARTILPLLLPDTSAQALGADLKARRTPGMLGEALRALGARVREVEIGAAEETVSAARVRLRQGGRQLEVAGRPSEAVALALSAGAPSSSRGSCSPPPGSRPTSSGAPGSAPRTRAET
jgi:bifunctional DNase/RNase